MTIRRAVLHTRPPSRADPRHGAPLCTGASPPGDFGQRPHSPRRFLPRSLTLETNHKRGSVPHLRRPPPRLPSGGLLPQAPAPPRPRPRHSLGTATATGWPRLGPGGSPGSLLECREPSCSPRATPCSLASFLSGTSVTRVRFECRLI